MTSNRSLVVPFLWLLTTLPACADDGACTSNSDCLAGRVCTSGVCVDPSIRDPNGAPPHTTSGGGGTGSRTCSCTCECDSCSVDDQVTCTGGGSVCESCTNDCRQACSSNPACGGFVSGSGTCK